MENFSSAARMQDAVAARARRRLFDSFRILSSASSVRVICIRAEYLCKISSIEEEDGDRRAQVFGRALSQSKKRAVFNVQLRSV